MNTDNTITDLGLDAVLQQYDILLAYLQRPVVLVQLGLFILTLFVTFGLTSLIFRRLKRLNHEPWTLISIGIFPLIAIVASWLLSQLLTTLGYPNGLMMAMISLLWIFFAYSVILAILYFAFGEDRVRPYHRRIVLPIVIIFVASQLLGTVFDLNQLGNLRLVTLGEIDITLARVFGFVLSIYFVFAVSGIIQNILRTVVVPRLVVDVGTSNAILTISRYSILALGLVMSFGLLGFDFTTLALIGGGLSIGIGFGLQQIVSNFLSGILLLFEQSLRPGDVIDIDGQLGTVQKLSIRSTTVRTLSNVDVVIPNERFLTEAVKNYTRSRTLRGTIVVGVSYNSDPTEVRRLLKEIVSNHGRVLKNPEPRVFFRDFGDSSLDFHVLFWVEHFDDWYTTETDLRMMIWRAFEKHKIEIPFPQRDLHIRSMPLLNQPFNPEKDEDDPEEES